MKWQMKRPIWEYPKVCVNLQTGVRYNYSVWRFYMARRKSDTPQKAAMREMMQGYLRDNDISIKSGTDVNSIMRDMMSVLFGRGSRRGT